MFVVVALLAAVNPVSSSYDAASDSSVARVEAVKPVVAKGDCAALVELSSTWRGKDKPAADDAHYNLELARWTMNFQRWSSKTPIKLVVNGKTLKAPKALTWE